MFEVVKSSMKTMDYDRKNKKKAISGQFICEEDEKMCMGVPE